MNGVWAAGAFAVAGALAGAWGAVLVRRVPRGVRISPPVCATAVAALWAVIGWSVDRLPVWWWPIPLVVAWAGVLLGATDMVARRLPDALTLPAYPVACMLVTIAAVGMGEVAPLLRAVAGAVLWAGGYAAVRLINPGALGGGDVKLAGSLGALTAAGSWQALLLAVLAATVLTALVAGPARLFGYREIPHGPAMLVAAWLVVLQPLG